LPANPGPGHGPNPGAPVPTCVVIVPVAAEAGPALRIARVATTLMIKANFAQRVDLRCVVDINSISSLW